METASLIASIVSILIAGFAVWLSVVFYRMSTGAMTATTESANKIGSSVDRLEKLFDRLYTDTFSMMRDTVTDMRRHMWPADEERETDDTAAQVEARAEGKIDELRRELSAEMTQLAERVGTTGHSVRELEGRMAEMMDRAIQGSRRADNEAREETIRQAVLRRLRLAGATRRPVEADAVVSNLLSRGFLFGEILDELEKLRAEGRIAFDDEGINPGTAITIVPQPRLGPAS